jgi:hypothetical protein
MAPLLLALLVTLGPPSAADDLASVREVFQRNITAIQERDREAYLACYLESEALVRGGADGVQLGYRGLADGAPATGGDDWPDELLATDLELYPVTDGVIYGCYRFRATFGTTVRHGVSERVFLRTSDGWRIAVTTAFDDEFKSESPLGFESSDHPPPESFMTKRTLAAVTAEVEALHAFFEALFTGATDDLSRCADALDGDFEIVSPTGERTAREPLLEMLASARGRHEPGTFAIRVEDVRSRSLGEGLHLVTYEEWHDQGGASRGRLSSALLAEDADAPGGFRWQHVHETWLPQ